MISPDRLDPDLQSLAISLEGNPNLFTIQSIRRSQSCSGQNLASTERRECRMGRRPEPAARAKRDARESPECRERSEASDQPRSGQGAARGSFVKRSHETPTLLTDGGLVESDYSLLGSSVKPPSVCQTGLGYNYVRCQRGGRDDTVYIHQLCAIAAGEDPYEVFSDEYDCHHRLSIPTQWGVQQIDTPENIELKPSTHHRVGELLRYDEYSSEVP